MNECTIPSRKSLGFLLSDAARLLRRRFDQEARDTPEIWIELGLAVSGLWAFVLHVGGRRDPFIDPRIFRDRNLVTALAMIFMVGVILLAGLALLIGKVDARLLILAGLGLIAFSLWQMTGFSPVMDSTPIIVSGIVQGLGLGLVFVPLSTLAFATLEPRVRADAASLFSLMRNLGSSVGISVVVAELARNIVINRAELGARLTEVTPNLDQVLGAAPDMTTGLAMLNGEVQRQAAMIAYVDDFRLMMLLTIAAIPLLLLMRSPDRGGAPSGAPAMAD